MFKKPFSFKGRIRRTEYGISLIIAFLLFYMMMELTRYLHVNEITDKKQNILLSLLTFIIPFIFLCIQGIKRSHDIGNSGWWLLLLPLYIQFLIFQEGERESNKYGDPLKKITVQPYSNKIFEAPFLFSGRIRRREYALTLLIVLLFALLSGMIINFTSWEEDKIGVIIAMYIVYTPIRVFFHAQAAKRCHDIGKSGWWQLVPLYYMFLIFQEGDMGSNKYGEDPKAVVNNRVDSFSSPYVSPHNNMPQNDFRYEGGHNGNGISEYNTQQSSQYNHASQQLPYTDSKKVGFQKGDNIYGKKH